MQSGAVGSWPLVRVGCACAIGVDVIVLGGGVVGERRRKIAAKGGGSLEFGKKKKGVQDGGTGAGEHL